MDRHQGIVKEFLDVNFGNNLQNVSNAHGIYERLLTQKNDLEEKLSVITTEVPTKIEGAIRLADASLLQGEALIAKKNDLVRRINQCLDECNPIVDDIQGIVFEVKEVEKYVLYLQWLEYIEELSGEIQQCILSNTFSDACRIFKRLVAADNSLAVQHTKCECLRKYTSDTVIFWHKILKDKIGNELEKILKQASWPFVLCPGPNKIPKVAPGANTERSGASTSTNVDLSAEFERVFINLLEIQLPEHLVQQMSIESGHSQLIPVSTGSRILLPLQLMLKPLKIRFRYHFSGKKQTNLITKPEWYLTQVLNWVKNHSGFLETTVQPLLDSRGFENCDSLIMFTKGLLQLVCHKLSEDMNELVMNDDLFSHTIDEVLLFDRELRGSYGFPSEAFLDDNPLSVFMIPECLHKWISIEQTCALDRLDSMLSSDKAWCSQYGSVAQPDSDSASHMDDISDESKVPECAESFITMLLTITDRYKNVPLISYQQRFLDLQLLLLDDFRIRLTQILKMESSNEPLGAKHFAVLNAAYYVTSVLTDWSENLFFLELKHKQEREDRIVAGDVIPESFLRLGERGTRRSQDPVGSGTDNSVFDGMLKLYDRLYKEGIDHVSEYVCNEVKENGRRYITDSWLTLPSKEEQLTFVVSRTACPMLQVLQQRLHLLEQRLSCQLFSSCWHSLSDKIDFYLFTECILKNHFNVGGAAQLEFDMARNLFPLFGSYTRKPENFFRRLKESCSLLNLQSGSALLLHEVLTFASDTSDPNHPKNDPNASMIKPTSALTDIGVTFLSSEAARAIMQLRIDWAQNT